MAKHGYTHKSQYVNVKMPQHGMRSFVISGTRGGLTTTYAEGG